MYMEKELAMLDKLSENELINQRMLSKILDMSLGSVNMLINKMRKEGFIKCRSASSNQVAYMLTPEGIAEKANKTYKYVTYHYRYINDMKEKIKSYLENRVETEKKIYLLSDGSELSEIVLIAIKEMNNSESIKIIKDGWNKEDIEQGTLVILVSGEDKSRFEGCRTEIVLEMV